MRRFLLLFTAGLLSGCGGSRPSERAPASPTPGYLDESRASRPRDGGTLNRRLEAEPPTLNAVLQDSDYESFVLAEISRNLIDFDKDLKIIGGLADRWEISPDQRTYTFHIRDEAVWEDGSPVTAADAVFTIQKIVDPKVPAALLAPNMDGLERVEAIDAKSFRTAFSKPYAFRLEAFNFPILPATRYAGEDFLKAAVNRSPESNGPYRFESWKAGESISLVRNDRYWGPRAHFDRVVFRILPDNTQAYRALEQGGLDEMRLSSAQWQRTPSDVAFAACCRVTLYYDLSFFFLGYNNRSPLFSDSETRRALAMLLDRPAIARNLYGGTARILSGPWAQDVPAYDKSVAPYPFDPAAAARELEKAGWRRGSDGILARQGARFDFELLYGAGSDPSRQIGEVFRAELARAGIVCRVRPLEAASLFERMDAGNFQAILSAWSGDPNPDPYPLWHSSQAPPKGLNNLSYSDPAADRIMEQARVEFDAPRRNALYHHLHRIIHDDAPATFVFQSSQKLAVSLRIGGLVTSPIGPFKIWPGAVGWWDRGVSPGP
jgi:peptide/nickel transport system substrate-binding protein